MSHSPVFSRLARLMRIARWCELSSISTREGLDIVKTAEANHGFPANQSHLEIGSGSVLHDRRTFIAGAAGGLLTSLLAPTQKVFAATVIDVGIVGAGLAGLACADALKTKGINATIYDANTRTGGRCFSLRNFFPGQVAERGGEFIDNLHKTMLGYAKRFRLTLEDVNKRPGDVFYFFNNQLFAESVVVDQFREFVAAMRADLRGSFRRRDCRQSFTSRCND